jgi:UDP-N-acetylglucosamine/UDP-N-acetylgalactosamine diphosphorylase
MNDSLKASLQARLEPLGQEHLLRFWDQLDPSDQQRLADEIESVDLEQIQRLIREEDASEDWAALARRAVSPQAFRLDDRANRFTAEEARESGEAALSAGEVGVVLVAGGQGSRLGFDHPKGMYQIGPVSEATLYQIFFEQIVALRRRHGAAIALYLMTSEATHRETVEFLAAHARFGLPEKDLHIFQQGTMPAVDATTGKLLLAERGHVALSPDGHGGTLAALDRSGALEDMRRRGLKQLFYFQVDNPLVRICDPEFLGYHRLSRSEMSTWVVAKQQPEERVGIVVQVDDQVRIIEYSDLPDDAASRREPDSSLSLWAGNTAIHAFDVAFLSRVAGEIDQLPFHRAHKKVPHVDEAGQPVDPQEPNATKFERFIFDLMPLAQRAIVVEVHPATSFAPVKNAPGAASDTPELAQAQMVQLHTAWLQQAGVRVDEGVPVEISPLYALDAQTLAQRIEPDLHVTAATYFC